MNTSPPKSFPALGSWRLIRATHHGLEIDEPLQEGSFYADGSCIQLIQSRNQRKIYKIAGKFFYISPDHFWVETTQGKCATQKFLINGDEIEFHHQGVIHYLKRINETAFIDPVVESN
jgi:hypothetical protein